MIKPFLCWLFHRRYRWEVSRYPGHLILKCEKCKITWPVKVVP